MLLYSLCVVLDKGDTIIILRWSGGGDGGEQTFFF